MKNELTYTKIGDYYFPNIKLDVVETEPLNKYGRMRRTFLREHNSNYCRIYFIMKWLSIITITREWQSVYAEWETGRGCALCIGE